MRISPIGIINNVRNISSNKNNKNQTNVFQKNNQCDSFSFTGVKENFKGANPFTYKEETRKAISVGSDILPENTEAVLSKIDERANTTISEANFISQRAKEVKDIISSVYDESNSYNIIKKLPFDGYVKEEGEMLKVFANTEEDTCLTGNLDKKTGQISKIEERTIGSINRPSETKTYQYNEYGEFTRFKRTSKNVVSEMSFKPQEITTKKEEHGVSSNGRIVFSYNDNITLATFEDEDKNGKRVMQKETFKEDGRETTCVIEEILPDEGESSSLADFIQYI